MRTKLLVLLLILSVSLSVGALPLSVTAGVAQYPEFLTCEDEQFPSPPPQPSPDVYRPAPARDLYELARRLKPGGYVPASAGPQRSNARAGEQQVFWIVDIEALVPFTVTATLRYVTPHAHFYVQDGLDVSQSDLQRSADEFDQQIYPLEHRYLGTEWLPGIDGDEHLTVLNAGIPGVAGYFSMIDEYPRDINPYSNEREIIYMNLSSTRPGTSAYNAVLAHEFAHAIHWNLHRNEESWVSEGLAELAATIAGYKSNFAATYAANPDTQLNAWSMGTSGNGVHYGAGYLFMMYLTQQYGGYEALPDIISQASDGMDGIDAYLTKHDYAARFDDVFRDWLVANYLNDPAQEHYHYQDLDIKAKVERKIEDYGDWSETVHQYGADYVELNLPPGGARISFVGDTSAPLAQVQPYSGSRMWWSNRGDGIDATLTRELDLSGVDQATLQYAVWYDIERNWDYAYVEASTDGGATWSILSGTHSSPENPLGLSFGPGYTSTSGESQPEWQQEEVDLTPYAGQRILLRFEYVTDEGTNGPSLFLDDIAVPEIDFFDDAEGALTWQADGFLRTDGVLPQKYILQLLTFDPQTAVTQVPVDADGQASLTLENVSDMPTRAILIIAGATPVTTEVAHYQVDVEPVE
ncbi:MAG: hypothetical protein EPO21_23185 [Chloroflexota bacterium]|nr:MAG: hypothetical protein EPO21_23185 [Chloroflexota bacterium]